MKEIYQESDLSFKDGKFSASTDMDEVMDVLPADLRKRMNLDRSLPSANRVQLEIDRSTGKVTLKIPDLMLSSLDLGGVTAGKTRMTGITLSMDGGGGVARDFAEKKAGKTVTNLLMGKEKAQGAAGQGGQAAGQGGHDTTSTLRVQSVLAQDVVHGASKSSVKELSLQDLFVQIANKGGGLPGAHGFEGGRTDNLTMDFSVGSATVKGLSSPGAQAGSLGVSGVKGSFDQQTERGSLSAASIQAGGLNAGGKQLGSGQVRQLSAQIDNKGGGLPFFDQTPDHLQTQGGVGSAQVSGLNTGTGSLGAGSLEGGRWAQRPDGISVGASALSVQDLKGASASVASGSGRNVSGSFGADGHTVTGDRMQIAGVKAGENSIGRAEAEGLRFKSDAAGTGISADARSLAVSGVDTAAVDLQQGRAEDLRYRQSQGNVAVGAGSVGLTGLKSAGADAASVSGSGVQFRKDQAGMAGSADQLALQGGRVGEARLKAAAATGLDLSAQGGVRAGSAKSLSLTGLDTEKVDAAQVNARDLQAREDKSGIHLAIKGADAAGLDAAGNRAAAVSLSGLDAQVGADRRSGSLKLGSASATGLDTAAVDAKGVRLDGLDARLSAAGGALSLKGASATGLSANGVTAGSVGVGDVRAEGRDAQHLSAGVGSLTAKDIQGKQGGVASLQAQNLSVGRDGQQLQAGVASASATGLRAGDSRVGAADLTGLSASGTDNGTGRIGLDGVTLRDVDTASVDAKTVTGKKLAATAGPNGLDASAKMLGATGVSAGSGGTAVSIREIGAEDVAVRQGKPGAPIVQRTAGSSAAGMAGLIDDADIRATAGLTPGKMSAVTVKKGTDINARVKINDGQIDPRATRADFSKPLDGPLWTGVNGVYMDPQKDGSAKVKADVSGFFDLDITKNLPGGQKTLPTGAAALAGKLSPQATPGTVTSTPSTGLSATAGRVSASGVSLSAQSQSPALSGGGPVDLSRASVSGSASLKSGTASVGAVKADLMREDARDNSVQFGAQQGGRNLALEFTRLLVGSFSTTFGGTEVQAGKSSVGQGQLSVAPGGSGAQVKGTVGSVQVEGLGVRR